MEAGAIRPGYELWRPNREKPEANSARALVLVPVQVILIAVAMVAFNQEWHVEEERPIGDELPPVEPPKGRGPTKRRTAGGSATRKTSSSKSSTTSGTKRRTTATRRPKKA